MEKLDRNNVIRIAGAYVAWVMGSGFATGQEILQFFTSYGYYSFVLLGINLVGFLLIGPTILQAGRAHAGDPSYDHFIYFCGRRLGMLYSRILPLSMFAGMIILISGAGATLQEYYGLNHYVGALLMAAMALIAYIIGFQRFVRIVSFIGPSIIAFSLFVGIVTVCRDFNGLIQIGVSTLGAAGESVVQTIASAAGAGGVGTTGTTVIDAVVQTAASMAGAGGAETAGSAGTAATTIIEAAAQTVASTQGAGGPGEQAAQIAEAMEAKQPVPWWWLSGLLYISYNLCGGSKYYSALGAEASSYREALWGGIVGTIALMASIFLMNTAMLTDIAHTAVLDVPTLYLARKITYSLGAVFSIILIMGIFSSCSAMLWTICEKFVVQGSRRSYLFAGCTSLCAFLLGLLPFAGLVGVVYTILGYIGLIFAGCVVYRRVRGMRSPDESKSSLK